MGQGGPKSQWQLSVKIDDEAIEYFEACARIRGISTTALITRLMRAIAADHMVLAILDDKSARDRRQGECRWRPSKATREREADGY